MSVLRAGLWLSVGIALGRFAGFVRESILAQRYGLGPDADVAVLVLTIPDSLLNVLIGSAMGAALIPALAALRRDPSTVALAGSAIEKVDRLHTQIAVVAVAVGLLLTVAATWGAEFLVRALAPGMSTVQVTHTSSLVAIGLWAMPITVLSSVLGAGLQERERFASTALGTLVFNGAIIVALLVWQGVLAAIAWAMVAGALLRLAGQFAEWRWSGGRWQWRWLFLQEKGSWLPERALAVAYVQVLVAGAALMLLPIAGRWFASFAGAGSIAGWTYATKLFELPLQVLITVFATALFPRFSQLLAAGDDIAAKHFLQLGGQVVLVCATAVAVVAAWFAVDLVQLAFRLPAADGAVVAGLVQVLLIGLPFAGLTALLQAWYAASRDTRTPLIVGIIGVGCFLAAGWPVLRSGGLVGLAWLAAAQYALGCALLVHRGLLSWRVLVPCAIAAGVALGLCLLSPLIDGSILRLALAAVAGSVAVAAGLAAIPGLRQFANR